MSVNMDTSEENVSDTSMSPISEDDKDINNVLQDEGLQDDTNDQYNWGCKVDTRNNPANELPYFRGPHTNSGLVFNNNHWIVCNRPVSVKTDGQKYQLWEEEEWPMLSVYGSVAECPQFFKFTELPILRCMIYNHLLPKGRTLALVFDHQTSGDDLPMPGSHPFFFDHSYLSEPSDLAVAQIWSESREYFLSHYSRANIEICSRYVRSGNLSTYYSKDRDIILLHHHTVDQFDRRSFNDFPVLEGVENIVCTVGYMDVHTQNISSFCEKIWKYCKTLPKLKKLSLRIGESRMDAGKNHETHFDTHPHLITLPDDFSGHLNSMASNKYHRADPRMDDEEDQNSPLPIRQYLPAACESNLVTNATELRRIIQEEPPAQAVEVQMVMLGTLCLPKPRAISDRAKVFVVPQYPEYAGVTYYCYAPVLGVDSSLEVQPKPFLEHSVKAPFFVWDLGTSSIERTSVIFGCDGNGMLERRYDEYEGIEEIFQKD